MMRFLFVDKITSQTNDTIRGCKYFAPTEPLRYQNQAAPGIVSEAIGQLASWKCISDNGFSARPVFLFADRIEILAPVPLGSQVDLEASIQQSDSETFVFSGKAMVDGQVVQTIEDCSGYFMPLEQLEDPAVTRQRYAALTSTSGLELVSDGSPFEFPSLIDEVEHVSPRESLVANKSMTSDEPFLADHFPRFPVMPIVMINEMIGQATARLIDARLQPRLVERVKIKNFVRPEEQVSIHVKLVEELTPKDRPGAAQHSIRTMAEVKKQGKSILRGFYTYDIKD